MYALQIGIGRNIITDDNYLLETIASLTQRIQLLFPLFVVRHTVCRLNISPFSTVGDDKVNLMLRKR